MKSHVAALALLGSAFGAVGMGDVQKDDPGTWCITYLSTYLAPISIESALPRPSENSSDYEPLSTVLTHDSTLSSSAVSSSADSSVPTSAGFEPAGQRVILLISPSGDTTKRDTGGFVGDGNPDTCTFATIFTLGQGRLSENGIPLAYLGDGYQKLQSSPALPLDAITTTFSSDGGILRFANSALPNGQASFCQVSSDGQVYMTFTSKPSGCASVILNVYAAEQCVNGRLDGLDTTTTGTQSIGPRASDTIRTGETELPTVSESSETEISTDDESISTTFVGSLSNSELPTASVSSGTELSADDEPTSTSSAFGGSLSNTEPSTASESTVSSVIQTEQTELPIDDEPTSTTLIGSLSDTTETLTETSELEPTIFPTLTGTGTLTDDTPIDTTDSPEVPTSESSGVSSSDQQSVDETDAVIPTSSLDFTTDSVTSETDLPSESLIETTTTTQPGGDPPVITNAVINGRFAKADPNSGSGIAAWSSEGETKHQDGDCYKIDGSTDSRCVALGSSADARKRVFGGSASIFQMVSNMAPSRTVLYTVQFYYVVVTVGGRQMCSVSAYLGNRNFYYMDLFSSGGVGVTWKRVLTTVRADSRSANFGISMDCSGNGFALIYVDSVFISNQVTPDNIDQFQLDFGDGGSPQNTRPPSTPTRRPIDPATSDTEEAISTPTDSAVDTTTPSLGIETTSDNWEPTTRRIPQNTTDWLPNPETSTGSLEATPATKPTSFQPPREETSADLEPTFVGTTTSEPSDTSYDPTQAPSSTEQDTTATSETTTTSEAAEPTCKYTHGEKCNFDSLNYPKDALCNWANVYNGDLSWTVSRTDYPIQDTALHCIAICHGLPNCISAGYWRHTNRCYFSSSPLNKDDFDQGNGDYRASLWMDKRCWKNCEECVPDSVPKPPSKKCSYTLGDECQRTSPPDGVVCDYSAWMAGGYWSSEQFINEYPADTQSSPGKCAAICNAMPDCKGSGYRNGQCQWSAFSLALSGMPIPLDTHQDPSWNLIWDDPRCFTCPGCE